MKIFSRSKPAAFWLTVIAACLLCSRPAWGAVGVTVSPSVITNDYLGKISITVTGLTSGTTIRIEKFADLNTNGVINAGEFAWRSFTVTDGQLPLLAGCTNLNVAGDMDGAANGQIRAELFYPGTDATLDRGILSLTPSPSDGEGERGRD